MLITTTAFVIIQPKDQEAVIGALAKENLVISVTIDDSGVETRRVDNLNILQEKIRKTSPTLSDNEIAKILCRYLGEPESVIENLPEDKLLEVFTFKGSIQTTSYIKCNQDGSQTIMPKAEMLQELSVTRGLTANGKALLEKNGIGIVEEPLTTTVTENVATNSQTPVETVSNDGYLRMVVSANEKTGEYDNRTYYVITVFAEWLKEPYFKIQDVLAITSNATYDNSYNDFGYFREECIERYLTSSGEEKSIRHYEYNHIYKGVGSNNPDAISFEYTAGIGGVALRFDMFEKTSSAATPHFFDYDISAYLRFKCSLYNTDGGVQAAYGHKQLALSDISVDLSTGSINMSIVGTMETYYSETLSIYYNAEE